MLLPSVIIGFFYCIFTFYRKVRMKRELSFTNYYASGGAVYVNTYFGIRFILKYTMLEEGSYPFLAAVLLTLFFLLITASIQAREKLYKYSKQLYPQAFSSVPKLI